MSKSKNRPKRQQKKRKQEYKKAPRGRKFNPWVYKYFDVTAEQYGDCDKCGYTIRQAYSPVYEGFYDRKRGWKDSDGIYHEKNYKRHRRVRRKHLDRVKQVDQSLVVRYM